MTAPNGGSTRRVAVLGGNRIPFARSNGAYATASNQDMFTAALDGLVARFGLEGERLGEVAGGAVLKHSHDFNLVRESVLGSRLAPETPARGRGMETGFSRGGSPAARESDRTTAPRSTSPCALNFTWTSNGVEIVSSTGPASTTTMRVRQESMI